MNIRKIVCTLLLAVLLMHTAHMRVYAQEVSLVLSPASQAVYVKPGTSVVIPFTIKNTGEPTSFLVKPVSLIPSSTHGNLTVQSQLPRGISVTIPEKQAEFFGTGQEKQTTVTIAVHQTLPEQDYYLGLMIQSVGKKHSEGKSSIELALQPLSMILLTVTHTGILKNSGYIHSLTINQSSDVHFFDSNDAIPIELIVGNSGDNWLYTSGTITITDIFGTTTIFQIPQQRILANSKRLVRSTSANSPDHSLLLTERHVGKYTISARLTFERKSGTQTRFITFVAFPFKLAGLLLGLGISALVIVSRLNHPAHIRQVPPERL